MPKFRKNYSVILEKNAELTEGQADRRMDRQRQFYRALYKTGVQKMNNFKKFQQNSTITHFKMDCSFLRSSQIKSSLPAKTICPLKKVSFMNRCAI